MQILSSTLCEQNISILKIFNLSIIFFSRKFRTKDRDSFFSWILFEILRKIQYRVSDPVYLSPECLALVKTDWLWLKNVFLKVFFQNFFIQDSQKRKKIFDLFFFISKLFCEIRFSPILGRVHCTKVYLATGGLSIPNLMAKKKSWRIFGISILIVLVLNT